MSRTSRSTLSERLWAEPSGTLTSDIGIDIGMHRALRPADLHILWPRTPHSCKVYGSSDSLRAVVGRIHQLGLIALAFRYRPALQGPTRRLVAGGADKNSPETGLSQHTHWRFCSALCCICEYTISRGRGGGPHHAHCHQRSNILLVHVDRKLKVSRWRCLRAHQHAPPSSAGSSLPPRIECLFILVVHLPRPPPPPSSRSVAEGRSQRQDGPPGSARARGRGAPPLGCAWRQRA